MAMKTIFANPAIGSTLAAASGTRSFAIWSSPKDPALEEALSRNRPWIVNNQIKNLILRYPNQSPPVRFIQAKFKTLDLQGKALNWLRKHPCCFDLFPDPDSPSAALVGLTKRMAAQVLRQSEPRVAQTLARLLLMAANRRLNVVKLGELKRSFGLPDDFPSAGGARRRSSWSEAQISRRSRRLSREQLGGMRSRGPSSACR